MSEEELLPSWSYDLTAMLDALSSLLAHCEEIAVLEEKLTEVLTAFQLLYFT